MGASEDDDEVDGWEWKDGGVGDWVGVEEGCAEGGPLEFEWD